MYTLRFMSEERLKNKEYYMHNRYSCENDKDAHTFIHVYYTRYIQCDICPGMKIEEKEHSV